MFPWLVGLQPIAPFAGASVRVPGTMVSGRENRWPVTALSADRCIIPAGPGDRPAGESVKTHKSGRGANIMRTDSVSKEVETLNGGARPTEVNPAWGRCV
jgi:hypothetical protein